MKLFIFKLFIFTFITLGTLLIGGIHINKVESSDYQAAIVLKHNRLDSIQVKRVIFLGGSNVAFGVDSEKIEKRFKRPVVNLGLHAGLGLEFMLNEAADKMRDGDTLFLSIENLLAIKGDYRLLRETAKYLPRSVQYANQQSYLMDLNEFFQVKAAGLKSNFFYILKGESSIEKNQSLYMSKYFNSRGDMVGHLHRPSIDVEASFNGSPKPLAYYNYKEGIQLLNQFAQKASEKNVKVYFIFPNYPRFQYELDSKTLSQYESDLRAGLKIPILNHVSDFVYDDNLCFDTIYHLNQAGREKKTDDLIRVISSNKVL